MPISESAFAKINLSLQIVGRRHDGYHLLDSLVAFADLGDTLDIEPAENLSLITCGRYSAALPDDPDDNLVLRAARWLNDATGAKITLHKELPVASGMGGGSADAAAAIRGLARSWDVPVPAAIETECLGADVPVCVGSVTARVRGVGEQVEPVTCLPPLPVVLVNPGRQVSTGRVFSEYGPVDSRGSELVIPTRGLNVHQAIEWLSGLTNDLEAVAVRLEPSIAEVMQALRASGAGVVRMTGSGATCFGVYASEAEAKVAKSEIARRQDEWWIEATVLNSRQSES